MIIDQERLVDGFRGLVGMDGSRDPSQIAEQAVAHATNCVFRGGVGARTRNGFQQLSAPSNNFSGSPLFSLDNEPFPMRAHDVNVPMSNNAARFQSFFVNGKYFQEALIYNDPRENNPTQILVAIDGYVLALTLAERSCYVVNFNNRLSPSADIFMAQAEQYVIIQDGASEPLVYDGYQVYPASAFGNPCIPVGQQMAYGHGRLFVAVNGGREIMAGDLIFGGSTTSVAVGESSADFPAIITTEEAHGFLPGDAITLTGHSSTPEINGNAVVSAVLDNFRFVIPAAVAAAGTGGFVSRFNGGQGSDLLLFNEHTFLAEGGAFALPSEMGRVKVMSFVPMQDDASGQGDLITFCERGAASFAVSTPRSEWKTTKGFQRVLFRDIGSASRAVQVVNGDLFFRSLQGNGIRSYRTARASFESYGQTPMSAELDPILKMDTPWLLDKVSFAYFDGRLLMTCLPRVATRLGLTQQEADELAAAPPTIVYDGIVALDFHAVAANAEKSAASYDGIWTGLSTLKLIGGQIDGAPRCLAIVREGDIPFTFEDSVGRLRLFDIGTPSETDVPVARVGEDPFKRAIPAVIETRGFNFNQPFALKKLIRCDLWFDDLGGGPDFPFRCWVYYKADDSPNWTFWHSFEKCFNTEYPLTAPAGALARGYLPQFRLPTPELSDNAATGEPAYLGYEFSLKIVWEGRARLSRLLIHALNQTERSGS
jgi:hypothetical protein